MPLAINSVLNTHNSKDGYHKSYITQLCFVLLHNPVFVFEANMYTNHEEQWVVF